MQGNLKKGKLLNENGELIESGWSTEIVKEYLRSDIKASKWRIKEWDYYLISNNDVAIALTFAENSYMSLSSVSFLDFNKPSYKTTSDIKLFTFGKNVMPSTTKEGDIIYKSKRSQMIFKNDGKTRYLSCKFKKFDKINGKNNYMDKWTFTSNDGKFEMSFSPIIDRIDNTDLGIIVSKQHQVFGLFSGKVVLSDNSIIEIKDKLGFAEEVYNKW